MPTRPPAPAHQSYEALYSQTRDRALLALVSVHDTEKVSDIRTRAHDLAAANLHDTATGVRELHRRVLRNGSDEPDREYVLLEDVLLLLGERP